MPAKNSRTPRATAPAISPEILPMIEAAAAHAGIDLETFILQAAFGLRHHSAHQLDGLSEDTTPRFCLQDVARGGNVAAAFLEEALDDDGCISAAGIAALLAAPDLDEMLDDLPGRVRRAVQGAIESHLEDIAAAERRRAEGDRIHQDHMRRVRPLLRLAK